MRRLVFGLFDQPNDVLVLTVGCGLVGADVNGLIAVDGPGHHGVAGALVNGARLTGQRGFVDRRGALQDRPVDGDGLAGLDQQFLAHGDGVDVDIGQGIGRDQVGVLGRVGQETLQLGVGTVSGEVFQRVAPGQHQ